MAWSKPKFSSSSDSGPVRAERQSGLQALPGRVSRAGCAGRHCRWSGRRPARQRAGGPAL